MRSFLVCNRGRGRVDRVGGKIGASIEGEYQSKWPRQEKFMGAEQEGLERFTRRFRDSGAVGGVFDDCSVFQSVSLRSSQRSLTTMTGT